MGTRAATSSESAASVEAITQRYPAEVPADARPAEVWVLEGGSSGPTFYVNFVDPSRVRPGEIYKTWLVNFPKGSVEPKIQWFRSRRTEDGSDETLPP